MIPKKQIREKKQKIDEPYRQVLVSKAEKADETMGVL